MRTRETRCDLCGTVITSYGASLIGALKLKYKAKRSYEEIDSHCNYSRWKSIDICPDCLEKIIKGAKNEDFRK